MKMIKRRTVQWLEIENGSVRKIANGREARGEWRNAGECPVEVTLDIVDLHHLEQIVSSLKKINGVFEVERVMQA